MNPILAGVIFVTAFVVAWVGVGLFRSWSLRREIFDVPNERSSHTVPTPRGGGVVIVAVTITGYVLSTLVAGLPISYGYVAGALLISLISWFDDLVSIPFWARLAVHIAGSALLIADIGYWQEIFIPTADITIPFGPMVGAVVTMGWLVWFINAYNFMDGIDGIAGIQAVVAGIAWAVLSVWMGLDGTFLFAGILACASLGFLMHNWAPAKIFMGDVGSAYLGFTLAAIPLLARTEGPQTHLLLPAAGILFVWYFIFDSVFTFCRRLLLRQRVWEAHREHIYQRMVISGWTHATVTQIYGVSAVILSATVVLAIIFSGKFVVFAILSILIPTLALVYFGIRKKV